MAVSPLLQALLGGFSGQGGTGVGTPPFVPEDPSKPPLSGQGSQKPGLFNQPSIFLNLLANSGYSTMPQSPLANFGQAALQTQAQNQQLGMSDLQKRLIESQIGLYKSKAEAPSREDSPFGAVDPAKFTQESIKKFSDTGDYGDLVLREGSRLSTADIANYEFLSKLTPEQRELFFRGKRDPRFQSVPGVGFGAPNQTTGEFQVSVPEETIVGGTENRAEAGARGSATGAAQGDQTAKAPVYESFKVAEKAVRDAMQETPQGGFLGFGGRAGGLFDYQDAKRFDNSVQQLSTELRTVFRIPGEGTLSDREQEQYNLQLPSRTFDKETNDRILKDLDQRINARLNTPIGGGPSSVDAIADKYLNDD